jgi:photosystem II stability/assembly factor-like uncharacterized protein
VAAGGNPHWSEDGATWTRGANAPPNHVRTMVFGDGVFVGAGDRGQLVRTTDGAAWEAMLTAGTDAFRASSFGAGRFVVVGEAGAVAASADGGNTWFTQRIAGAGALAGVAFAGGQFFAGDGSAVYVSTDGLAWTRVNTAPAVPHKGVGRTLLGWGSGALQRSVDGGFSWTRRAGATGGLGVLDLAVEAEE